MELKGFLQVLECLFFGCALACDIDLDTYQ